MSSYDPPEQEFPEDAADERVVEEATVKSEETQKNGQAEVNFTISSKIPVMIGGGLAETVVALAVNKLVELSEKATKVEIKSGVSETIQKKLDTIIEDVINSQFRLTNSYGEPKGEPITLRQLMVDQAKKYFEEVVSMKSGRSPDYSDKERCSRVQYEAVQAAKFVIEQHAKDIKARVNEVINAELTSKLAAAVKSALGL